MIFCNCLIFNMFCLSEMTKEARTPENYFRGINAKPKLKQYKKQLLLNFVASISNSFQNLLKLKETLYLSII
jgi:hypothetical protein